MEDFNGEIGVAVLEDSEDEHEGLDGDDPVAGLADAFGDGLGAGGGVGFGGGDEGEDLTDVLVVDRNDVVGGGLEDGNFEAGEVGGIGDLG